MSALRFLAHAFAAKRFATGAMLAGAAMTAAAQQSLPLAAQQDLAPVVQLAKVEVTGSKIARIDGESGLPVQIITREELLDGGVQTMQELLQRISANQSFGSFTPAQGEGKILVGFTAASLRGLGSQRTLILLNGRRLAPYALSGGQSVDLSSIPASALERVEILKDGASAVYGTDAIGGVINFILRKDYQGAEVGANYYGTDEGGGNNGRFSITAGHGDLATDKYNAFFSASYFKQDALKATQREFTKTSYLPALGFNGTSGASYPANILQRNFRTGQYYGFRGSRNPTIPFPGGATPTSCLLPFSFPTTGAPDSPYSCGFDFASTSETIPEAEQINAFGRFAWQFAADHQFFAEGAYYRGQFTQRISPTPVSSRFTQTPMTLPSTSPYYPTDFVAGLPGGDPTLPLELSYRTVELGPRTDRANVDQWNAVAGLNGVIAGWDYQLAAIYTANQQTDNYISGAVYESKFGPLLRSGAINPFAPNSDATLALMRATQVTGPANDNRASNYGATFNVANTVYDLPGGPLAVSFGMEGRRESLEQSNSDFIVGGDVLGGGGDVPSLLVSKRSVFSLFGEVNIPITKSLEANVAVRYDHYSDFGGTTNPKVTLRWQPAREVVLRASYGTGFRAPTLSDLFQPVSYGFTDTDIQDPIRCPVTGDYVDCDAGIRTKVGGNPLAQPETSQQANVGVVLQPTKSLSATMDYYWVTVDNVIQAIPANVILGTDYANWTRLVVRNPPDSQYPNLPGQIDYIVQYPVNVGTLTTSGIDFSVQWQAPPLSLGQFSFSYSGTYVLSYEVGGYQSPDVPSGPGTRGLSGAISRFRQYAQLNWSDGPWAATLANGYQSGYDENCLAGDASGCITRRVGAYTTWDLQARYTGVKDLTLSLGVMNLMNTTPPLTNQGSNFQVGIDPTYADPRGRLFYGSMRYAFK